MMQIQQPDIAGNFLSAYYTAQQAQQAQQDRATQQQRMARQDQMTEQRFDMEMDANQLRLAVGRAEAFDNILRKVRPGDNASLERAKSEFVNTFGGDPRAVAGVTMDRVMELRAETDLKLQELRARIAAVNRSNRGAVDGGGGAVDQYDPENPFAGLTDKARERLIIQNTKDYNAVARENDKEVQGARAAMTDADRFVALSKQVNAPGDWSTGTGALAGFPGIRQVQTALDSRFAEMDAITARLVPKLREPGSGATSDFDARMFQRGTLDIGKPGPANDAIALGMKAAAQNLIDKAGFEEAYFRARKTLVGSQDAWNQYLEANPIFDPASEDMPKLNKSRQSWRRFFGSSPSTALRSPAPPAAKPSAQAQDDFSDVDAMLGLK